MIVTAIKTKKVTADGGKLFDLLDQSLSDFRDSSILAITSKVISICQGRTVRVQEADKFDLIRQESDCFLPRDRNKHGICLTIKNGILIPSAGIDESNGDGHYVLWPTEAQKVANEIRAYLMGRFGARRVGIIITDSTTSPLRRGVTGICIAHSGFEAIRNLIGSPDIFGQLLKVTQVNVADGIAASAVLVMGESNEQTPLAIISDVEYVEFQEQVPSAEEVAMRSIGIDEDIYEPLLTSIVWHAGGRRLEN